MARRFPLWSAGTAGWHWNRLKKANYTPTGSECEKYLELVNACCVICHSGRNQREVRKLSALARVTDISKDWFALNMICESDGAVTCPYPGVGFSLHFKLRGEQTVVSFSRSSIQSYKKVASSKFWRCWLNLKTAWNYRGTITWVTISTASWQYSAITNSQLHGP